MRVAAQSPEVAPPRILVGTLSCGEPQLEACIEAVRLQQGVSVEHVVLKDLPNRESHEALYNLFMSRSNEFELFVKIDADMVLLANRCLRDVAERFAHDRDMEMLTVLVRDFFTDSLIEGLHAFRNTVRWTETIEEPFIDRMPILRGRRVIDREQLAPLASHAENPNGFQAFHFGLHAGVKLAVARRSRSDEDGQLYSMWVLLERTWKHYRRSGDARLGVAVLGGELATLGRLRPEHVSYQNRYALQFFEHRIATLSPLQVLVACLALRTWNRRGLPSRFWMNAQPSRLGVWRALRFEIDQPALYLKSRWRARNM